jgi:hypothetical protein
MVDRLVILNELVDTLFIRDEHLGILQELVNRLVNTFELVDRFSCQWN